MARRTGSEDPLGRARDAKRESKSVEFKEKFDPTNEGEWIELVKDFVAIANSGGGVVVVGVRDNGRSSGESVQAVLDLDAAKIADKLVRYTGENFDGFAIHDLKRSNRRVAAIAISGVEDAPLVFRQPGSYTTDKGKPKTAFVRGAVYFRHGAKSEPATTDDLRRFIERRLALVRESWLGNLRKVVSAPAGSDFAVVQGSAPDESGTPTKVRLSDDPEAPLYGLLDTDTTYPHRQKELVAEVNKRLEPKQKKISRYDIDCLRRVDPINKETTPQFCRKPKFGSMQYSDAFVDWLVDKIGQDKKFFAKVRARDLARRRASV
jgi:hypothetical protein